MLSAVAPGARAQQGEPGTFPFFRSFMDKNTEYVAFPAGHPRESGTARPNAINESSLTTQGLVLTYSTNQVGAFYLPQHTFSTDDGLLIEFEYIMHGADATTDGMIMFLVDAQSQYIGNNLKFGAEGAGFGYTHRLAFMGTSRTSGILGAYLAVALDQGPFKTLRMVSLDDGDEMRNGIYYTNDNSYINPIPVARDTRSNVTIRGAAGRETITIAHPGQAGYNNRPGGTWGYPVLITRHTNTAGRNAAGYKLNPTTGLFQQHVSPVIPEAFNIARGAYFTHPGEPAYRKAIIALEPNPTAGEGGFKISVSIQHGETITPVIENFTYPKTVTYVENGYPVRWDQFANTANNPARITYTVDRPEKLVIGFAGATGWSTPYTNIIRNLRITPLYAANTANDDIRDHRRGPVTVRPFDNDLGYKEEQPGSPGSVVGHKDFLDPASFRFWTDENHTLLDANDKAIYEYEVADKGKWIYDPATKEVLFFPVRGFTGDVNIYYDIKGQFAPFNQEKYRSSLAAISITIADNQPVR